MTVEEFDAGGKDQACRQCGQRAMVRVHVDDNNGERVTCPACQSKRPWGAVLFLKQSDRRTRPECPETLNEVWARFGDRCVVCSRTAEELAVLHVGRNRQHVAEYVEAEHRGPLVPICARCHQIANALQRDAVVMRGFIHFSRSNGDERSPGSRPAVPQPGLSPDPVRAAGETPAGALEGFSDDDADR